jgi:hypothetical protein
MSEAALQHAPRKSASHPAPSFTANRGGLLQRKCACGGKPGPTGECGACRTKRGSGTLQRAAHHPLFLSPHSSEVSPIVPEVLRSSGHELDVEKRTFREPRFGHSFDQVPVHSDARAGMNPAWQGFTMRSPWVGLRAKLAISVPDDPYEQEADAVADQVMQVPNRQSNSHDLSFSSLSVPRPSSKGGLCVEEEEKKLQREGHGNIRDSPETVPPIVYETLRSSGQALDSDTRSFMEERFDRDFGDVRLHTDGRAMESARAVNALAYTVGRHIVFGRNQYSPHTPTGQRLLAHELTHVVQQNSAVIGAGANAAKPASISQPGQAKVSSKSGPILARLPSPPDCHTRLRGLSSIGPIVKESYDGTASTTIDDSIWPLGSWERRWQIYDASDGLVWESFYTIPKPTLTIPKALITGGTAGGEQNPWSAWIKVTQTMVPFGADDPTNFPHDYTTFPVFETAQDREAAQEAATQTSEDDEWKVHVPGIMPTSAGMMTSAGTKVTPEIALELIKNMSKGEPPFKPELGKGGCSWFVSEGNPHTGPMRGKDVSIQAEIARPAEPLIFDEAKLEAINQKIRTQFEPGAEARYRQHKGILAEKPLSKGQRGGLNDYIKDTVESQMWDEVGKQVGESGNKVGEVVLQNSRFSKSANGKFLVVADASKIQIKGGMASVVSALESAGSAVEPVVKEAAEVMASRMKWVGRVKNVFRYGGRVMIVVAVAADLYKVYTAQDKTKAVITSLGGWAGASIGAAAFAAWWTPADVAGPWAWVGHGVGTLAAGGVGYWVGSESVRTVYELVLEE